MIRIVPIILAVLLSLPSAAQAADKREGYYYPPVGSEEVFARQLTDIPQASRAVRVGFITQITKAQLAAPESPRFVIFAKGKKADQMIIIALDDEIFKTLFRARAVLAQLTANARGTDFFIKNRIAAQATWFDLAKLLGFKQLVVSDGETWSHRVMFQSE